MDKHFFIVRVTKHWHSLPREGGSLEPWRYSKAVWTWCWATGSRWLCFRKGIRPDNLHRSLPTSNIL